MKVKQLMKSTWHKEERPNFSFPEDYIEILVGSFQGHNPVNLLKGWEILQEYNSYEGYKLDNYLREAGFNDEQIKEVLEKSLKGRIEYLKKEFKELGLYYDADENFIYAGLYLIGGSKAKIIKLLEEYFERCQNDNYWASGDDSFFDYTPDEINVIYQICCSIEAQEFWERYIMLAYDNWYSTDPDETIAEYFEDYESKEE